MPRLLALVLAGCALILGACGGGVDRVQSPDPATAGPAVPAGPATPASPVATQAQQQVPPALDFTAPAIGGGDIQAARYAGRPVVLWFWSPW